MKVKRKLRLLITVAGIAVSFTVACVVIGKAKEGFCCCKKSKENSEKMKTENFEDEDFQEEQQEQKENIQETESKDEDC